MRIDSLGNVVSMNLLEAKRIVGNMLRRNLDYGSPDFYTFSSVQHRALAVLLTRNGENLSRGFLFSSVDGDE